MQLDNLYQEVILDHYKHPENKGLTAEYDAQVHHINPSCGDEITLNITLAGSMIKSVTWDGLGLLYFSGQRVNYERPNDWKRYGRGTGCF